MKDYQCSKVYTAEEEALDFYDKQLTFKEVIHLCKRMVNSHLLKQLVEEIFFVSEPAKDFTIERGDARCVHACANNDMARFPEGARTLATVCHEMAHAYTIDDSDNPTYSYHGAEFCGLYLELIKYFIGGDAYTSLLESFDEHDVEYYVISLQV